MAPDQENPPTQRTQPNSADRQILTQPTQPNSADRQIRTQPTQPAPANPVLRPGPASPGIRPHRHDPENPQILAYLADPREPENPRIPANLAHHPEPENPQILAAHPILTDQPGRANLPIRRIRTASANSSPALDRPARSGRRRRRGMRHKVRKDLPQRIHPLRRSGRAGHNGPCRTDWRSQGHREARRDSGGWRRLADQTCPGGQPRLFLAFRKPPTLAEPRPPSAGKQGAGLVSKCRCLLRLARRRRAVPARSSPRCPDRRWPRSSPSEETRKQVAVRQPGNCLATAGIRAKDHHTEGATQGELSDAGSAMAEIRAGWARLRPARARPTGWLA